MHIMQSRRSFMASCVGTATLAAGLVGTTKPLHAEPPPETTSVKLVKFLPASCDPPLYFAEDLLHAEGFTDVIYREIKPGEDNSELMAEGELDFNWDFAPAHILAIDSGLPIKVLGGMHSGCLELIANESISSVGDLKGKKVGVYQITSQPHVLVALMAAYVGLDPHRDIEWVENDQEPAMQLFIDGKIDAFLAIPPEPQELHARKIGHTILASAIDRPWSQYFCCLLTTSADYAAKYPVATKRVMRAILKSVDLCVSEPARVAKQMIDRKFATDYGYTLQAINEIRYDRWRDYDPDDTMRFYALRLQETGFIKSSPQAIIANGTDWRFFDELKRELKT
jgi:NitT/TauT family transport system substrate-binding protein